MDVFAVPSKTPTKGDSIPHDAAAGSAVQGLIATFSDILRNAGVRMESDATSLIPKTKPDVAAARRDTEPADRTTQSRPERRDDATAAPAERPRRARDGNERTRKDDTNERTRKDDTTDETRPTGGPAASEKADRAKTPASAASEAGAPAKAPEADGRAAKPAAAGRDAAGEPATTVAVPDTITAATPDDAVIDAGPTNVAPAANVETASPSTPDDFVASVLATQGFAEGTTTADGPATSADMVSAVDGLAVAATAAGRSGKATEPLLAAAAAAVSPKTAPAAPQPATVKAAAPQGEVQTAGDTQLNAADIKVQQAAALSRLTGNGNLVAVRTTVTEPSAHFVSQPAATLSAPIVAATDPAQAAAPATTVATPATPATPAARLTPTAQPVPAAVEASPLAMQNQQAEAQMARSPNASAVGGAAKTLVQPAGTASSAGMQTSSGGGDGLTGSGAHATLHNTPAAQHAPQAQAAGQPRFTVPQQAAVDQVSVQIAKAVKDGIDRIHIQLRPAHMGRVDVRLEVADGRVSAMVTADTKETLEMLQRDARELERAFQQAGLQTDTGSLNFSLRGQQGQGQEGDRQMAGGRAAPDTSTTDEAAAETPAWTDYPGGIRPDGRVDIRA